MERNALCNLLNIRFPIIMAPMFLVSNESMVIEASKSGIAGAIPALNYRTTQEFQEGLIRLKNHVQGAFGVNLIVNKSNFFFEEQLRLCLAYQPDFIITSLGSPEKTIQLAHAKGIKVFCDVVGVNRLISPLASAALHVHIRTFAHFFLTPLPTRQTVVPVCPSLIRHILRTDHDRN